MGWFWERWDGQYAAVGREACINGEMIYQGRDTRCCMVLYNCRHFPVMRVSMVNSVRYDIYILCRNIQKFILPERMESCILCVVSLSQMISKTKGLTDLNRLMCVVWIHVWWLNMVKSCSFPVKPEFSPWFHHAQGAHLGSSRGAGWVLPGPLASEKFLGTTVNDW